MRVQTSEEKIAELQLHIQRRDEVYAKWNDRRLGETTRTLAPKYEVSHTVIAKWIAEAKQAEQNRIDAENEHRD